MVRLCARAVEGIGGIEGVRMEWCRSSASGQTVLSMVIIMWMCEWRAEEEEEEEGVVGGLSYEERMTFCSLGLILKG